MEQEKWNYKTVLEYLEDAGKYGIVPGLDSIRALCAELDNPQDALQFVHIAGTNGKGSVLAYVSTILKAAGYKVGRYISPTIFEYRERIQVNGRMISQKDFTELSGQVKEAVDRMVERGLPHPTPFELDTAMAFLYFQKKECDVVVLETGMGGKMDATNLIKNTLVAVLTSISMDHMKFLGKTLTEIAEQKAGIIKRGCQVVSMKQASEAEAVIRRVAKSMDCEISIADPETAKKIKYGLEKQRFDYDSLKAITITLAGHYQITNAVLAYEVIRVLNKKGFSITEKALRKGFLETSWPGRFQVLSKKPYFIVDGAHNEDAAGKLAETIRFYFTNKKIIYIMGILRDKEYEKIIQETVPLSSAVITVKTPDNPRAMDAYELAKEVRAYQPNVTAVDSLEEAVEMSYLMADPDSVILAFGSLSYLGQMITLVEKHSKRNK
ncbi:MAG: bifunctional folylpolyglutamate synthase/dihydrofolate synthase [Lachnospiraceae bacterium]|nr:bifunctional folylpolyglutamate synthase/dihydrofolate synthase [Lachnospiraceae bacterium]